MVHSPPILILDEPTAGVDVNLRQLLWDSIKDLNKKGTSILLTTRYLEELKNLCKEVIMIGEGKVLIKGANQRAFKKHRFQNLSILFILKTAKLMNYQKSQKIWIYFKLIGNVFL